ncbi:MAG: hypothetical protein DWH81_12430 [Planctomycetota bacterium]|nr:MAG: hypothetical protein DWH81_12430 [Planctomycetota bacterium]
MLAGTTQPGKPAQCEQETPFRVRAGVQNRCGCCLGDIRLPLLIAARGGGNIALLERIGFDQFPVESVGE